ncbi:hypothetical protein HNQ39_001105 [Armatimonas rosea]|jgi:hypothetical protein|uniref:Uncharacterized protein n=1 Tax=Armatimonas rosea TaxID=685828 RepID=A0A7W9SNP4_ARMRO|nr:hypothetical protein [Armatimonas rosea]
MLNVVWVALVLMVVALITNEVQARRNEEWPTDKTL